MGATPGEARVSLLDSEQIARQPRPSAVSIGEGVDCYEAMMKAKRQFISRVGGVGHPIPGIFDELPKGRFDEIARDAKIAFSSSVSPRPTPNPIEHSAMQSPKERLRYDVALSRKCPAIRSSDIALFELVEFATQGNVSWNEPIQLYCCQWCSICIEVEETRHSSSQSRAGCRRRSSTLCR